MHQKLLHLFEIAETERRKILELAASLPEEKLSHHVPGKWSISQILAHLIAAEKLSVLYMEKKSLGIKDAGDTGLWEEFKFMLLKISQRLPLKYKAPKVLGEDQPPQLSLAEISRQWNETRNRLRAVLEKVDHQHIRRKIYKHAISGRLNAVHAVSFIREHVNHHLPQIMKLMQ